MKLEEAIKSTRFKNEAHKATLNLLYTTYWLKTNLSRVLKEHALTMEQYNVLRILKGKHPEAMCVRDISSRMIEKNSNVPRIADRLVEKKLVKRKNNKEDKRETNITLTEKGLEHLNSAIAIIDNVTDSILDLTEDEALKLNGLLEKMRKTD